jgi:DNA-binding GntR family transcriptional regulator
MKGLRQSERGGSVVCYVHSYIPHRLGRFARELRRCAGPFYAHLAERANEEIIEVDQELHGKPMDEDVASHLDRPPGTISLCALRRYVSKRGTVIASYNWHVAEDFHYRTKLLRTI